ncbi:hypothetical protein PRECH8_23130 [Insulibacter thermoxylanivorax]|uniref:Uncharacterized protein n=1 Tax=Insulibacter thermoxylanivorax TaxID=2749268 RepID=A0A916QE19_9BACL|nr:hypothetical protein PRECH8_23130 [Insulibacter thermoxylanivorax]
MKRLPPVMCHSSPTVYRMKESDVNKLSFDSRRDIRYDIDNFHNDMVKDVIRYDGSRSNPGRMV